MNYLFAFLTTEPNKEVGAINPKAMPVILTTPEEIETWMTAPAEEAFGATRPGAGPHALRLILIALRQLEGENWIHVTGTNLYPLNYLASSNLEDRI